MGQGGVFCTLFKDEIWQPVEVAVECGEYDPVPWAPEQGAEGEAATCSSTASP